MSALGLGCDCDGAVVIGRKLLMDLGESALVHHHHRRLQTWEENPMGQNIRYVCIIFFLVCGSGLMSGEAQRPFRDARSSQRLHGMKFCTISPSGLTLGLLSLDHMEMEVLRRSGTPAQKRCAAHCLTPMLLSPPMPYEAGRIRREMGTLTGADPLITDSLCLIHPSRCAHRNAEKILPVIKVRCMRTEHEH